MTSRPVIGFVGLGVMGSRMVSRLVHAGEEVMAYDTRHDAVSAMAERGARAAETIVDVTAGCDVVLTSLPTPAALQEVANSVAESDRVELLVDLSTVGPAAARSAAAALGEAGLGYVDAPVSGGPRGAAEGTLTIMVAGAPADRKRVAPYLAVLGKNVNDVGDEPGQGQAVKLANNLLSATAVVATTEALLLATSAGVAAETALACFNTGSGRNTATADKFPNYVLPRTFDFGFRMELMAKDVHLCTEEARDLHVPMVLGTTVDQLWALAMSQAGGSEADATEIVRMYEQWAGLRLDRDSQ